MGVDNNARIIGITKKELDTVCNFIQNINDNTLSPKVTIEMDHVEIDKKIVGVFQVKKSDLIIQNGYDDRFYIRRGSTNRVFESNEISELLGFQKALVIISEENCICHISATSPSSFDIVLMI